jgi:hypothetical protein
MLNSLFLAIRFLILVFSGHKQVALENIALRHQLAVFTREKKRPRVRDRDRLFWRSEPMEGLENCARIRSA